MKFNILLSAAVIVFCSSTAQAAINEVSDAALSTVSGQLGKGRMGSMFSGRSAQDNPYHVRAKLGSILFPAEDRSMPRPGSWIKLPYFEPKASFALDVSGNDMALVIGLPKSAK